MAVSSHVLQRKMSAQIHTHVHMSQTEEVEFAALRCIILVRICDNAHPFTPKKNAVRVLI